MTPERWRQITGVFHDALGRDAAARRAFLDEVCAGDRELRAELDAMLAAHHAAGSFGEAPMLDSAEEWRDPAARAAEPAPDAAVPADGRPPTGPRATGEPATPSGGVAPVPEGPHPFLWVLRFSALVTVAVLTYAAWLLATKGGDTTSFGWSENERKGGWYVTSVDPSGPAAGVLRPGDRLLRLEDIPPAPGMGTRFQRRALGPGDRYRLAIERDGRLYARSLSVAAGESVLAQRLTTFLVGLVGARSRCSSASLGPNSPWRGWPSCLPS